MRYVLLSACICMGNGASNVVYAEAVYTDLTQEELEDDFSRRVDTRLQFDFVTAVEVNKAMDAVTYCDVEEIDPTPK